MDFETRIARNEELGIWYVSESALPGLHAEAATLDELVAIIRDVAPDLIVANCLAPQRPRSFSIPLRLESLVDTEVAVS